jgi:predicted lipoprotein with Yx(FWY)xxD motif
LGARPYRGRELATYIDREHRRGRDVRDLLSDGRVTNCGSEALIRAVVGRPSLIGELSRDATDAIGSARNATRAVRMRRHPLRRTLAAASLVVGALTILAAGGQAVAAQPSATKKVVISTRRIPKLGTILVDSRGRTLYMFVPDKRNRVTCVHACAAVWPPVKLVKGAHAIARGKARSSLLGSDRNPTGGRVVTYRRWPLYAYVGDTAPGQARGQALNLNGGLWYVLAPSGNIIRKKL